jgi:RNase P/RNase MRP subunit p29
MAYLRVGAQVTICENFNKNGRNWKNVTGYILMMTRKEVTVQTEYGQIIVPRKKVVAN